MTAGVDSWAGGFAWFGSALAFAVAMSATPGPNNAMVAASGARWGIRRTLPHVLGISLGFPVMLLAVASGAGEVLQANPWVDKAMRWVGAAYLLWLAWSIARRMPIDPALAAPAEGRPLGFLAAALFQWVNPKAWVIAVGAIVTFTDGQGGRLMQALALAAIFAGSTLPFVLLWTYAGAGATRLLRTPRAMRRFDLAMAALLAASLVPMLLE